jgi:drug/metabolite transporter (DMT)-like permease
MTARHDERSLGELFAELSRETGLLVRKEIELATTEMTAKARVATRHATTVAVGGVLAHAALLVLLAAIVIGLAEMGLPAWLSALIVAIVAGLGGYLLVQRGLAHLRRTSVAPTQTMESLKETTTWTNRTPA